MSGQPKSTYLRALKVLLLFGHSLGLAPTLWKMSGTHFLPSQDWVQSSAPWLPLTGACMAGLLFITLGQARRQNAALAPTKRANFVLMTAPFIAFFLGQEALLVGVPLLGAVLAGRPVALGYTVANADDWGDRNCRRPIVLRNMPLMHDRLCFYTEDFRQTLAPGGVLSVTERGTAFGLFPAKVLRLDD